MSASPTTAKPSANPAKDATAQGLYGRDFLGIAGLDRKTLLTFLDEAARWKGRLFHALPAGTDDDATRPVPVPVDERRPLAGRRVLTLFYENSTRTMQSFHIAARLLGAEPFDLPVRRSSVGKGESLLDTLLTVQSLGFDAVVIRHPSTGAAHFAAQHLDCPVINAGDGTGEHPTQALLDALTIREHKGTIDGLRVAIVGDIRHSRVARSNIHLLTTLGAEVRVVGPRTMLPDRRAFPGVLVTDDRDQALVGSDVVMVLRVQRERQDRMLLASLGEYRRGWGIDLETLRRCCPDALIMHPGPVNRGVELDSAVLNTPRCVVGEQVRNGIAARMAVLQLLLDPTAGRSAAQPAGREERRWTDC